MFSIDKLPELAAEYIKKYKPDTGYTKRVAQEVYEAYKAGKFPAGTNIGVQLALQYDGIESEQDLVINEEEQLPYKASYSLDEGADCADWPRNLILLMFKRNIGNWTQGIYNKYKDNQVDWEERRPFDVFLWKLSDRNPNATHAALCIGDGMMLNTGNSRDDMQLVEDTKYAASKRTGTGVFRVLSDEEYESLIVGDVPAPEEKPSVKYSRKLKFEYESTGEVYFRKGPGAEYAKYFSIKKGTSITYTGVSGDYIEAYYKCRIGYVHINYLMKKPMLHGDDVKAVQQKLLDLGFFTGSVKGNYGPITAGALVAYQKANKRKVTGIIGRCTWRALFK